MDKSKTIEYLPMDRVILGDRGREDYGDVEELAQSIKEHGLLQPITVCMVDGAKYRVVSGGRRYKAHELLEEKFIGCIIRNVKDDATLAELELVENIYRKDLTWQERCKMEYRLMKLKGLTVRELAEELEDSKSSIGRDVIMGEALEAIPALAEYKTIKDARKALDKMKESIMADELASRTAKKVEDNPAIPDIDTADIDPKHIPDVLDSAMHASKKLEDKDSLVASRLKLASSCYNIGDCLDELPTYGEPQSFHFAEIDPPYGIDLKSLKRQGGGDASNLDDYTDVESDQYYDFLRQVADEVYVKLTSNAFAIFWFGPTHQHATYTAIKEAGFSVNDVPAIWIKKSGQTQQPSLHLANCYEPFYVARKGSPPLKKQGRSNIFEFDTVTAEKKYHPTQRPLDLMEEILSTFVFAEGMRILVPFLGSGVTIRAAFNKSMLAVGWDLSNEYRSRFLLQIREDVKYVKASDTENVDEGGSSRASEDPGEV